MSEHRPLLEPGDGYIYDTGEYLYALVSLLRYANRLSGAA
jgi:hypothetical protein